jgi:hypothetical protein
MPVLTEEELKAFPEPTTADVVPGYVARYWDLVALADKRPVKVIGAEGVLRDRARLRGGPRDPRQCQRHAPFP